MINMFNLVDCAMTMHTVDKNDVYTNVTENRTDTMSFLGTLSPAASSEDSTDVHMDSSISASPTTRGIYSAAMYMNNFMAELDQPFLKIVEEPVEKFRFRYKSEMAGTHGSLIGMNSDKIRKSTYPTVQLENFDGRAFIRCSIYQFKSEVPHAHRLVMKADAGEKDDPHDVEVSPDRGYTAVFKSMGIIHTAKKYLVIELSNKLFRLHREDLERKGIYRNFTQHEEAEIKKQAEAESKIINLNKVRLKFEAYREIVTNGYKYLDPLCPPIYSHAINNLKSALTGELKIVRLDYTTASCVGGQEIFILVEKVTKNNIKVRFYECDNDDNEIWSDFGKFSQNDVHHQYAIVFKAPPYRDVKIENPVDVFIELVRPSDGARSEPRIFKYKPSEKIGRKRVRYCESLSSTELPATINNLSIESSISLPEAMLTTMDPNFFNNLDNVNSKEFDDLFKNANSDYESLTIDGAVAAVAPTTKTTKTTTTAGPSCKSSVVKRNNLYKQISRKVVTDVEAYVKTNPTPERLERLVENLFHSFRDQDGNNALHSAILSEEYTNLRYLLLLLSKMRHLKLLDLQNNDRETALHLAVQLNEPTIVRLLLPVGANTNVTDENGNTPLHLAVLNDSNLDSYIQLVNATDLEIGNDAGHTPLYSAVLKGNLDSVKTLTKANANVNHQVPSTGNTVLHLAVDEQNKEIIKFLLENTNARIDAENHSKMTPVHLAKVLQTEGSICEEIFTLISAYVETRGFESLMIKEEPEDDSSSEESDHNLEIKLEPEGSDAPAAEPMDVDENAIIILKNSQFTKDCISELGKILDGTDVLEKLSKDLNFEEIQNSLKTLTTNQILNYAYVTGISVYIVRDLLKKYGIPEAVKIIDQLYLNYSN